MAQQLASTSKVDWRVINWLRGLAAFYVVLNHSRGFLFSDAMAYADHINQKNNWAWWEWLQVAIMQFTNAGTEFVIVFFLLSGFSIAHSLNGNSDTVSFYKRRFIRLYPTYIVGIFWALIVFVVMALAVPDVYYTGVEGRSPLVGQFARFFLDAKTVVANLLYIPINNYLTPQYWSLPYEVLFYLIAPWMIKKHKHFGLLTLVGFSVGLSILGRTANEIDVKNILLTFFTDYTLYFYAGFLMYKYCDLFLEYFYIGRKTFIALAIISFVTMVMVKAYVFDQNHNKMTGLIAMAFTYIVLFGSLKYGLRIKWLEKIGTYSYTLYVTHIATLFLVKIIAHRLGFGFYMIDNMFVWYAGVAASVGFGYLLYHFGEKQSNHYLDKLRSGKMQKKSSLSATMGNAANVGLGLKIQKPTAAKLEPVNNDDNKSLY